MIGLSLSELTSSLFAVAAQVAILFVLVGAGAVMRRARFFEGAAIDGIVNLLVLVVTPCLIVDVFQRPYDPAMLGGLAIAFGFSVFGHLAVIALARLVVRHRDEDVRRPLLLSAVFSNAGFMGIPLEHSLLGDTGVFFGIVYVAVFNLFIWSWGYGTMKPKSVRSSFLTLRSLVNPGTVGIALGLPLFFLSVKLPPVLGVPIHQIAQLNTPLAMIVIGYYLVGMRFTHVAKTAAAYVAMAIRLVGYPLLMIAAMYPFRHHLNRDMMLALAIAASAPVAAMVSMFSAKFGRDVDVSVAVVSASTLLSVLTMPVLIAVAMSILQGT